MVLDDVLYSKQKHLKERFVAWYAKLIEAEYPVHFGDLEKAKGISVVHIDAFQKPPRKISTIWRLYNILGLLTKSRNAITIPPKHL